MHRWSSFWAHRCSSCWARSTPGDSGSWVRKWASFESRNPPRTRETRACGTHEVMAIWKMINQRLRWSPMTISCGQGGDSTTNQTMNSSSMLIYQNCIARWQCFLFMDTKVVSAFCHYIWCIYIYIHWYCFLSIWRADSSNRWLNHETVSVELTFKQPMCFR